MNITMKISRLHFLITGLLLIACTEKMAAEDSWIRTPETTNLTDLVWGNATAGYSISISTTNARYLSGEAIDLRILVKNVGTNDVYIGNPWLISYDVQVILAGKIIEPTAKGKRKITGGGSMTGRSFKPGETEAFFCHYPLSEIYDLTLPGKYQITATRNLWDTVGRDMKEYSEKTAASEKENPPPIMPVHWVKVTSNELEIVVEKPPSKWWWW